MDSCPLREKHRILGHMGCSHDHQMCTNNWHDKCPTRSRIQSYHEAKREDVLLAQHIQITSIIEEGENDQP